MVISFDAKNFFSNPAILQKLCFLNRNSSEKDALSLIEEILQGTVLDADLIR